MQILAFSIGYKSRRQSVNVRQGHSSAAVLLLAPHLKPLEQVFARNEAWNGRSYIIFTLAVQSSLVAPRPHPQKREGAHLSPYTLCLFLLGLPPGVTSLGRPALSSYSLSNALLSAFGSTAASLIFGVPLRSTRRFSLAGGGVIAPGGVLTGGVLRLLLLCSIFRCGAFKPVVSFGMPMLVAGKGGGVRLGK
jgi:hypothetical protein